MRDQLLASSRCTQTPEPPEVKPEPLAVIPSGLSIAEITTRLVKIQTEYPDARVRRGSRNKWEIWPSEDKGERSADSSHKNFDQGQRSRVPGRSDIEAAGHGNEAEPLPHPPAPCDTHRPWPVHDSRAHVVDCGTVPRPTLVGRTFSDFSGENSVQRRVANAATRGLR